jgi:hypothetical protein
MNYPLLNVFLTTMWFFLWILWFILLFRVFGDLFRDDTLSGWAKAGWCVFVIVLPFLGVFVYLIARGRGMGERDAQTQAQAEGEFRDYVKSVAAEGPAESQAEQLQKLADLKSQGHLTEEEYERAKSSILV